MICDGLTFIPHAQLRQEWCHDQLSDQPSNQADRELSDVSHALLLAIDVELCEHHQEQVRGEKGSYLHAAHRKVRHKDEAYEDWVVNIVFGLAVDIGHHRDDKSS